jgi:hypothetical protein
MFYGRHHDMVDCAKEGALDSQLQVIKFTSCLLMVGGCLASSTTKTGRHDIAESGTKHQKWCLNQVLLTNKKFALRI